MDDIERREAAVKRLKAQRNFRASLTVYLLVNAFLVFIWSLSGGYFWPIWPILGWGLAVAIHGWSVYFRKPISEADIQREMGRSR